MCTLASRLPIQTGLLPYGDTFSAAKIGTIFDKSKFLSIFFLFCPLRFAEEVDDMADGLGGVELGVAGLVAGGKGIDERLAAAYPTVQAVQRHMGLAARKVQQRQLRLRITLDGKH